MAFHYSPSTGGFYHSDIHGSDMPSDAVAISAARHAQLMAAQAQGQTIAPNAAGKPVDVAPAPPSMEALRAERNRLLAASDYTQMSDAPLTAAQRNAWRSYRQSLRDLPAIDPASLIWPTAPTSTPQHEEA